MSGRSPVVLRDVVPEDAAALVALWSEAAHDGGDDGGEAFSNQSLYREPGVAEAASALAMHLEKSGARIVVALVDAEIVGVVVCEITTLTPITVTRVLLVSDLLVSPRFRRRAVASSLMAAAGTHAEEHECEIVLSVAPALAREAHRYLTKLGFSQVATVRAIHTDRLRSRLTSRGTLSRDTGKLLAVRRSLRRRGERLRRQP